MPRDSEVFVRVREFLVQTHNLLFKYYNKIYSLNDGDVNKDPQSKLAEVMKAQTENMNNGASMLMNQAQVTSDRNKLQSKSRTMYM